MDNIPEHIGSTNLPPPLIPADDYSLTESSISVSGGDVRPNAEFSTATIYNTITSSTKFFLNMELVNANGGVIMMEAG